jgi:hypothetical protein
VSVTGTVEGAAGVTGASRRASVTGAGRGVTGGSCGVTGGSCGVTGAGRGVTNGAAAESGWA